MRYQSTTMTCCFLRLSMEMIFPNVANQAKNNSQVNLILPNSSMRNEYYHEEQGCCTMI